MDTGFEPWHLWIIAGVCLFIGEVFISGFLLASLAVGCLVAGLVQYLTGDMAFAIGGFVVGAGASLALIRPYLAKALGPEEESRFGAAAMIGDVVTVSDAGDIGGTLKARYRDTVWSLRSDQDLFEGDEAEIIAVDGGTLVVKPR
ncbi:MAG: NfeD family protein [Pseudomonadota bacterium]